MIGYENTANIRGIIICSMPGAVAISEMVATALQAASAVVNVVPFESLGKAEQMGIIKELQMLKYPATHHLEMENVSSGIEQHPPSGRTQAQHNHILSLNKSGRR